MTGREPGHSAAARKLGRVNQTSVSAPAAEPQAAPSRPTIGGLALQGDKDSVPQLLDMLREAKGLGSQAALASALGLVGDARSLEPLVAMAGDPSLTQGARTFATVALGLVCDRELLPWNFSVSEGVNYVAATPTLLGSANGVLDIR